MRSPLVAMVAACVLVSLTRSAHADETVEPRLTSALATPTGMQSPAVFGTGLFLSSVGVAGIATGAYFFSGGHAACDSIDRSVMPSDAHVDACTSAVIKQIGGVVGLASGGAFFIAGIPAIAVGASSPANEQAAELDDDAPSAAVVIAPLNVSLVVSF